MFPRSPTFRVLAAAGFLLGVHGRLHAELVTSSPFLPPQGMAVAAPVTSAPLELRGITAMNGSTMFSIFDPAKKSGTWVELNETGYDFAVKKYDADSDTVTVDYQGRTLALAMRTPKIASSGTAVAPLPAAVPSPVPMMINGAPNPAAHNAVANPTPATEAARMADWSAEIQRRRDMRAQAVGQALGPQPQVTTQPAPMPVQVRPQVQPNQGQNGSGNNQRQRGPRQRTNP